MISDSNKKTLKQLNKSSVHMVHEVDVKLTN